MRLLVATMAYLLRTVQRLEAHNPSTEPDNSLISSTLSLFHPSHLTSCQLRKIYEYSLLQSSFSRDLRKLSCGSTMSCLFFGKKNICTFCREFKIQNFVKKLFYRLSRIECVCSINAYKNRVYITYFPFIVQFSSEQWKYIFVKQYNRFSQPSENKITRVLLFSRNCSYNKCGMERFWFRIRVNNNSNNNYNYYYYQNYSSSFHLRSQIRHTYSRAFSRPPFPLALPSFARLSTLDPPRADNFKCSNEKEKFFYGNISTWMVSFVGRRSWMQTSAR